MRLNVLALHGVVPRLAVCPALRFSAKSAFTVIFTSSGDLVRRSVALVPWLWGGARPYLRSASVLTECFEKRGAVFSGETMFQRDSLDVCFAPFSSSLQKTHLVADLPWRERFQSGPVGSQCRVPFSLPLRLPLCWRGLDQAQIR